MENEYLNIIIKKPTQHDYFLNFQIYNKETKEVTTNEVFHLTKPQIENLIKNLLSILTQKPTE